MADEKKMFQDKSNRKFSFERILRILEHETQRTLNKYKKFPLASSTFVLMNINKMKRIRTRTIMKKLLMTHNLGRLTLGYKCLIYDENDFYSIVSLDVVDEDTKALRVRRLTDKQTAVFLLNDFLNDFYITTKKIS